MKQFIQFSERRDWTVESLQSVTKVDIFMRLQEQGGINSTNFKIKSWKKLNSVVISESEHMTFRNFVTNPFNTVFIDTADKSQIDL